MKSVLWRFAGRTCVLKCAMIYEILIEFTIEIEKYVLEVTPIHFRVGLSLRAYRHRYSTSTR